jgi:anthranilate phosphoribosyltransferase
MREALEKVMDGQDLDEATAGAVLETLARGEVAPALAGAMLAALRTKGVAASEVRGFARAMRALARRPNLPADLPAIDIVGTGGDASRSLNVSTGTALLVAALGVPVVKHGNRSISSQSGSADVLEKLGLPLPLDEQAAADCLAATGFTFLFAPHYHPAMKAIAPVRQAMGVRTIFNVMGPLTNPAAPPYHLIGAYSLAAAELMAETFAGLGIARAFVVHGAEGWDEPTTLGPFTVFDVQHGRVSASVRMPSAYGFAPGRASELAGGMAEHNAQALQAVLRGQRRDSYRDTLVLGAALALEVTGRCADPREAVERVNQGLDAGAGAAMLDRLAAFGARRAASPAAR